MFLLRRRQPLPSHNLQETNIVGSSEAELSQPKPQRQTPQAPKMGFKLTISAALLAVALAIGFLIVRWQKARAQAALNSQTVSQDGAAPAVDVVSVDYAPAIESVGY